MTVRDLLSRLARSPSLRASTISALRLGWKMLVFLTSAYVVALYMRR